MPDRRHGPQSVQQSQHQDLHQPPAPGSQSDHQAGRQRSQGPRRGRPGGGGGGGGAGEPRPGATTTPTSEQPEESSVPSQHAPHHRTSGHHSLTAGIKERKL